MVGNDCGGAWLAWYMAMSAIMIIASFSLEVEQAVIGERGNHQQHHDSCQQIITEEKRGNERSAGQDDGDFPHHVILMALLQLPKVS